MLLAEISSRLARSLWVLVHRHLVLLQMTLAKPMSAVLSQMVLLHSETLQKRQVEQSLTE